MTPRSWAYVNKDSWGDGPWFGEFDRSQWTDEATGLACLIVRDPEMGVLCGYVGVPAGHPLYGEAAESLQLEVHGGVTYSKAQEALEEVDRPEFGIGVIPNPGEPTDWWWFGFHCLGFADFAPGLNALLRRAGIRDEVGTRRRLEVQTYRTYGYVRAEVERLATQLALIGGVP